MHTIHFDERSARCTPVEREDNRARLRRLKRLLPAAMEDLTARQREMVELYYFENRTLSQIARQLGVCPSTVSRCLDRAQRRLWRAMRLSL